MPQLERHIHDDEMQENYATSYATIIDAELGNPLENMSAEDMEDIEKLLDATFE